MTTAGPGRGRRSPAALGNTTEHRRQRHAIRALADRIAAAKAVGASEQALDWARQCARDVSKKYGVRMIEGDRQRSAGELWLDGELAYFALQQALTVDAIEGPDDDEGMDPGIAAQGAGPGIAAREASRCFLAWVPRWGEWMEYLGESPQGDENASYRNERAILARCNGRMIHPDGELLAEYCEPKSALPARLRERVRAHIEGYGIPCTSCRALIETATRSSDPRPVAALAANSPAGPNEMRGRSVQLAEHDRVFQVRYIDDAGFLRFFVAAQEERSEPQRTYRITFVFNDGFSLCELCRLPQASVVGVNAGDLHGHSIEELRTIVIEAAGG